jgi:hypothetical protein
MVFPDFVHSAAAFVPAKPLPEPCAGSAASAGTAGLPRPAAIVAGVPLAVLALSVHSVSSMDVPFAMPTPDSVHSVAAPVPVTLPEPAATTVASATTTGGLTRPDNATAVGTEARCMQLQPAPLEVQRPSTWPCLTFGEIMKNGGGTKRRRLFIGPRHGAAFWYSFYGSTDVTRKVAGCAGGYVEKKRPASVFKATMVVLEHVVEEEDQLDDDDLVTIVQFDDDGDAVMTDAWEEDKISKNHFDEEQGGAHVSCDFSVISEEDDDLADDVVPTPVPAVHFVPIAAAPADPSGVTTVLAAAPTAFTADSRPSVPPMANPFAISVPASVQSSVSALVPAALPEEPAATVSSAASRVPSVPPMAVPFAMAFPDLVHSAAVFVIATAVPEPRAFVSSGTTSLPRPADIVADVPPPPVPMTSSVPSVPSDHPAVSRQWNHPSASILLSRHVASTGPVSAPPVLRRSARLAAKNAISCNDMGTIFIHGRRRSARLASRAW